MRNSHPRMRRWIPAFAGMTILLVSSTFAKPPEVGPVPPLELKTATPERYTLKNGVVVYLLEDHELPLFDLSMKMKISPADEPEGLRGIMGVMGSVWRTGGTAKRTPEELNKELEFMSAQVETAAGEESASIALSCLTKDRAQTLQIFKDVLLNPAFREEQLTLAKEKILEGLRRKNDAPFDIARRAFRDAVYGKDHYYAWNATPEFVAKLKRKDLIALHKKVVCPDQAIMAISGDFNKAEMLQELENLFADWKPFPRTVPAFDYTIHNASTGSVIYVEKDYTQSLIYMGGVGITRKSPDQYNMAVMNYILGEGGPSRLFMQIRSRLGLAYVVGSFYTSPKGPGLAGVVCQTKAPSTLDAAHALKVEIQKMRNSPPADWEMQEAKDAIINSFVFRFESLDRVVKEQADLEFYGFPADYLKTYPQKIKAVGGADILKTAQTYFNLDNMKTLVVGDQKKIKTPLESLGPVTVVPLASIE